MGPSSSLNVIGLPGVPLPLESFDALECVEPGPFSFARLRTRFFPEPALEAPSSCGGPNISIKPPPGEVAPSGGPRGSVGKAASEVRFIWASLFVRDFLEREAPLPFALFFLTWLRRFSSFSHLSGGRCAFHLENHIPQARNN